MVFCRYITCNKRLYIIDEGTHGTDLGLKSHNTRVAAMLFAILLYRLPLYLRGYNI